MVSVNQNYTIIFVLKFISRKLVYKAEESITFMVQLLFLSELMDNFGVHYVCVLFRDQCYNEVKQDNKENNLIHEPNYVNDVDDNLR